METETDSTIEHALSGFANIEFSHASAAVTVDNTAQWSLSKTGSVSGNTVTWNITATKSATTSGHLVIHGEAWVKNTGGAPATIGNVVVNLQTKVNNHWKSASVDIANGTQGDAATTAKIQSSASSENKSTFTENSASGSLKFYDATNNSIFALVPELTIPGGSTRSIRFEAAFDNDVLHLTKNTKIRVETIVSFGNAKVNGNSAPNIDINGNGQIDPDEAHVHSVPGRLELVIPATISGNATPTLSDTLNDIHATGDVTFSNVVINLGATSGTVTATVDGGANGGRITNCAHLTSPDQTLTNSGCTYTTVPGIHLEACNTQDIGGTPTCTPGTVGCGWANNNFVTYTQFSWTASGATLFANNYDSVFASTFGVLNIGQAPGPTVAFTTGADVQDFIPQGGTPSTLNASLVDPASTSAGAFAGEVVALTLNVAFSDAGVTPKVGTTAFGDVHVCGTGTVLDGSTIRQTLTLSNMLLSNGPQSTITAVDPVLAEINASFDDGTVSAWAQTHLINGACPP